jgi:hypothetical protein
MLRVRLLVLLILCAPVARAAEPVDLDAHSEILAKLQQVLPGLGVGKLTIVGGAALSLAGAARNDNAPAWNDLDLRGVAHVELTVDKMNEIAAALTHDGFAELLPPGPLEFLIHHPDDPVPLHSQGFGLRLRTRTGLRFDVAVLRHGDEAKLSGYNSAESLIIPLGKRRDLRTVMKGLKLGTTKVVELHGHAADVLAGKVVLTNRHNLDVEPELQALRYLRAVEKVQGLRLGTTGHAAADLGWLSKHLPKLIDHAPEVVDPSYVPRVQEQAAALLHSGDAKLIAHAKQMHLDLDALARGKLGRTKPKAKIAVARR